MITLYLRRNCPYCRKVIGAIHNELAVDFDARYVDDHPENEQAVLEKGDKLQFPFMVDDSDGTTMYESDDIIEYLRNKTA